MDYRQLAYQKALKYGLDPDLFVRQIQAESAFRPDAVSSAGAIGLGQLMPATAKDLGVDPTDPDQNLEGAARYMKQLMSRYNNNPTLALAAYNAGMGNVDKAGGVPNFKETQNYVAKILGQGGSAMDGNNMNDQAMGAFNAMQEQNKSDKYKDIAGNLAVAFNSMRLNPDPNIASTIKDIRNARSEKQAKSKTLAYLEKIGRGDLVSAIGAGLSPREAISQMFSEAAETRALERQKELATFEAGLAGKKDERTASMKEFELAQADPRFAKFLGLKNPPESPEGLKELDKQFATSLGEGGGAQSLAAAMSDAAAVKSVLNKLEAGEPLTGPFVGSLPVELRAFISPEGVQAQQLVESVVQKQLRAILGGQFAQKEGEQLVKRAYNPQLTPEQNAARLRPLFKSLEAAAQNKAAMTEYFFNNNYSLGGYEGPVGVPSISSFMTALDATDVGSAQPTQQEQPAGVPQVGAIEQGYRFKGGDPSVAANWEKVN